MLDNFLQFGRNIRSNAYAAWVVLSLTVLLAAWAVYNSISLYLQLHAALPVSQERIVVNTPQQDIGQALQQVHIFGAVATGNLPSADFGMKLQGIFINPPPTNSRALIVLTGQAAQSYSVGDILPNGARVYQILPDSVVLMQNGKLVKLSFPLQGLDFNSMPQASGIF